MLDCCDYIAITNRLVNVILVLVYLWPFCRMCFGDAAFQSSPKFRGGSHQKLDAISLAFPEAMMRQRGTKVVCVAAQPTLDTLLGCGPAGSKGLNCLPRSPLPSSLSRQVTGTKSGCMVYPDSFQPPPKPTKY